MEPRHIKQLLNLFTVLFVVLVVMMSINEFGANVMTLILAAVLLSGIHDTNSDVPLGLGEQGGLIGMSMFDLDQYYDEEKEKFQFPGWDDEKDGMEHASDILIRLMTTIVLLVYFVKSGIFKAENLNPLKRFMMY